MVPTVAGQGRGQAEIGSATALGMTQISPPVSGSRHLPVQTVFPIAQFHRAHSRPSVERSGARGCPIRMCFCWTTHRCAQGALGPGSFVVRDPVGRSGGRFWCVWQSHVGMLPDGGNQVSTL